MTTSRPKVIGRRRATVEKVVDRHRQRLSIAKGYLVVDENFAFLERPLRAENFNVTTPPKGLNDDDVKKMIGNRVFVTKKDRDFESDAAKFDYGIISFRSLRFVDPAQEDNQTAKMIARAWTKFELSSERFRFNLTLKPNGEHVFKRLE